MSWAPFNVGKILKIPEKYKFVNPKMIKMFNTIAKSCHINYFKRLLYYPIKKAETGLNFR